MGEFNEEAFNNETEQYLKEINAFVEKSKQYNAKIDIAAKYIDSMVDEDRHLHLATLTLKAIEDLNDVVG